MTKTVIDYGFGKYGIGIYIYEITNGIYRITMFIKDTK